jgi:tight adherence protein C
MEYLSELLQALIVDKQMVRLLFVLFVVLAIGVLCLGIAFIVIAASDPVRKRMKYFLADANFKNEQGVPGASAKLEPVSKYLLPSNQRERNETKERLMHAGYVSSGALGIFYGIRILLFVIIPSAVIVIAPAFPELTPKQVLISIGVAAFLAFLLPGMVLDRLIIKRKRKLRNAFPDALDLLIVCVEAGMGLNPALQRVADELDVSHPELAAEFALVTVEIRAGIDRVESLKNLAKRTGLEDINGMVSLLAQSMRFGTSVAETLRIYSEDFRDKRMQAAEEEAAKVGTKMIFPMVLCLFPAFFVVAIGPAILKVLEAFK